MKEQAKALFKKELRDIVTDSLPMDSVLLLKKHFDELNNLIEKTFNESLTPLAVEKDAKTEYEDYSIIEQTASDITFTINDTAILHLDHTGDIFVKGNLVENDKQVVDGLREFIHKCNATPLAVDNISKGECLDDFLESRVGIVKDRAPVYYDWGEIKKLMEEYASQNISEVVATEKVKCGICGGEKTLIRGRYPNMPKRWSCTSCTQERLDQISDISSPHYGQAAQTIDSPAPKQ